MKNYREYDAYALSNDPSFREWVLQSSAADTDFWTDWVAQNPDCAPTVEQARTFLWAVRRQYRSSVTDQEVRAGVDRLGAQVRSQPTTEPTVRPLHGQRWNWVRWGAAAAILVLAIGLGWQLLPPGSTFSKDNEQSLATISLQRIRRNTTAKPLTILLTDGSVVTLEPGSQLDYPREFGANQRAVTLIGEAFFEVARRPRQPFVVTTNEFTTTVLGTSFRVRSASRQHRAFVLVQSGKVAVQMRSKAGTPLAFGTASPVILTRNQQVTSEEKADKPLVKTTVRDVDLVANQVNQEQVFDDVSVTAVFDALEEQYGVAIQYDAATLSHCLVNTAFDQENLRERLSAVCQAVGATYLITNDQIVISSSGCTL